MNLGDKVRDQAEAAKSYLAAEGFSIVGDSALADAFEAHVHTIVVELDGARKSLKLSYQWLEDRTAESVTTFLADRDIGRSLKEPDTVMCSVGASGLLSWQ